MASSNAPAPSTTARGDLMRRGRRLEYVTVAWNACEAVILVTAGVTANSVALVAFGLDSLVEIFASVVVVWSLAGTHRPDRERRAMRLIGVAFLLVAAYLVIDAVRGLVVGIHPEESRLGVAWLTATVVVMWTLAWAKRRTASRLGSRPLLKNASMTFIDGWLALSVIGAVVLATAGGWWWTDKLAGLGIAVFAIREGVEALSASGEGGVP